MIPTLLPAYGRDYKSKAAIADDLNNNKDFIISGLNLTYANKDQLITENFKSIVVRYSQQRKVTSFKLINGIYKWLPPSASQQVTEWSVAILLTLPPSYCVTWADLKH